MHGVIMLWNQCQITNYQLCPPCCGPSPRIQKATIVIVRHHQHVHRIEIAADPLIKPRENVLRSPWVWLNLCPGKSGVSRVGRRKGACAKWERTWFSCARSVLDIAQGTGDK